MDALCECVSACVCALGIMPSTGITGSHGNCSVFLEVFRTFENFSKAVETSGEDPRAQEERRREKRGMKGREGEERNRVEGRKEKG